MHEASIVQALLDRVGNEARARAATSVKRLRVLVGEQAGVDRELLGLAWEALRERSIAAGATLELVSVAAVWGCRKCGENRPVAGGLRCAVCGGPLRLLAGDELVLERIEMEVPDV